jgi:pilus assembly protein Flp/PilA
MFAKFFEKTVHVVLRDEEGITAIEYAILAALIGAGLIAAVATFTPLLTTAFTNLGNLLDGVK